jgi:hypothetical protein
MAFTNTDRQAGRVAMEEKLTPMQKAARWFLSGKPPVTPKNTPLGAVTLATEQRARLSKILTDPKVGLKNPHVTSAAVVIRIPHAPNPNLPADTILVVEGKEGQAVRDLEMYADVCKCEFIIAGLLFAVQDDGEKQFLGYPIERTPEGQAAVRWSWERQMSGRLRNAGN